MPTSAAREAQKAFRETEAEKAMTEHARAQKALHENYQRLRAERLAREASENRASRKNGPPA